MAINVTPLQPAATTLQPPFFAQWHFESASPSLDELCLERIRFARADRGREPADGGFAMKRGVWTGGLAEHELVTYATLGQLTIDLGRPADRLAAKYRLAQQFPPNSLAEMRTFVIEKVRGWQSRYPVDDEDLDWNDVQMLLVPQTDLRIRRRDPDSGQVRYWVRVRPDATLLVSGNTAMAVEFSTAKDPDAIKPARCGLNHWAMRFKQHDEVKRDPDSVWGKITRFGTRVEMLTLGTSYSVFLEDDEVEAWRERIALVGDALAEDRLGKVIGPACSGCRWQVPCWSEEELEDAESL